MNTTTKGCLTAVVLVVLAGVALYFVPMPDARDEEPQASVDVSLIPETAWLDNRYAGGVEQVPLSGGALMGLLANSTVGVFAEGEWGSQDTLRAVDLDTGATLWEVDGLRCSAITRNERLIVEASTVGCEVRVETGTPEIIAVFDAAGHRTDYPMPYTDSLGYDQWDDGLFSVTLTLDFSENVEEDLILLDGDVTRTTRLPHGVLDAARVGDGAVYKDLAHDVGYVDGETATTLMEGELGSFYPLASGVHFDAVDRPITVGPGGEIISTAKLELPIPMGRYVEEELVGENTPIAYDGEGKAALVNGSSGPQVVRTHSHISRYPRGLSHDGHTFHTCNGADGKLISENNDIIAEYPCPINTFVGAGHIVFKADDEVWYSLAPTG